MIGIFYSDSIDLVGVAVARRLPGGDRACFGRLHVWRASVYVLLALVLWLATLESGLHPTIAGMAAGLRSRRTRRAATWSSAAASRFARLPPVAAAERRPLGAARSSSARSRSTSGCRPPLHPWTSFVIVPLFALANAGVDLRGGLLGDALASPHHLGRRRSASSPASSSASAAPRWARCGPRLGALPQGVGSGQVVAGAALSGIGFTVSLLIVGPRVRAARGARGGHRRRAAGGRDRQRAGLGAVRARGAAARRADGRAAAGPRPARSTPSATTSAAGVDAPMTLVEYGDFECPFCGKATGVMRELYERFGDDLRYVFRHLPLQDVHDARRARRAGGRGGGGAGPLLGVPRPAVPPPGPAGVRGPAGLRRPTSTSTSSEFARELAEGVHAERVRRGRGERRGERRPRDADLLRRRAPPRRGVRRRHAGRASSRPVAPDPRPRLRRSGAHVRAGTRWRLPRHAVHGKMCGIRRIRTQRS